VLNAIWLKSGIFNTTFDIYPTACCQPGKYMHTAIKIKNETPQYVLDQRFMDAAGQRDILVPQVIVDGRIHRCGTVAKPHGKDGVYQIFPNGEGGWFQNWSDGLGIHFWWATPNSELSIVEKIARQQRAREAQAAATLEREEAYTEAARRAQQLIAESPEAPADHPYLKDKEVKPHGVRQGAFGELLVPVYGSNGAIQSLQRIFPDGNKLFLRYGRTAGGMFRMGQITPWGIVLICEGFATAATLHEVTGYPVVASFQAGNLKAVAAAVRELWPDCNIILCADDDRETQERIGRNPGLTAANVAARRVRGLVAVPTFKCRDHAGTDFNDLARLEGAAAVANIIGAVVNKIQPMKQNVTPIIRNNKAKVLVDELAELHVLGAMLRRNEIIDDVQEWVDPKHFFNAERRVIFERILELYNDGRLADAMMLVRELPEAKDTIECSVKLLVTAKQLHALALRIKELYNLRQLTEIAKEIEVSATAKNMTADEITAIAEERLVDLQEGHDTGYKIVSLGDSIDGVIDEANEAHMQGGAHLGLTSGFRSIDRVIGGIESDQLVLIGGRPSHGKTALGLNMAMAQAIEGAPIGFISLETGERRLSRRILAAQSGVDLQVIKRGMHDSDPRDLKWERSMHTLMETARALRELPLHIIEPRILTPSRLRPLVKKLVRTYGICGLYIDYIQLMTPDDPRHGMREGVASISKALRGIITEFNIPIFGLAQLGRGIESRSQEEQFPRLSDFKESGQLEQDADLVFFPQRRIKWLEQRGPDLSGEAAHKPSVAAERRAAYEEEMNASRNEATIILAKNKDGEVGTRFAMRFDGPTMRFYEP
jgi:replicative DNA helicase